ncbi:MAG: hypothetical protein HY327_10020 [Chloroflexi bacterium]|nr:hypothetical protein [Chloroflexota bacterium]
MTIQTINLNLPENLWQRLNDAANATQQSLDDVLIQTIRAGLPPNSDTVPERFRPDLRLLNRLDNELLQQIAETELDDSKIAEYETLLARNQNSSLTQLEQTQLEILREEADLLMFRRAYALALLKWRGIRISQADSSSDQDKHSI